MACNHRKFYGIKHGVVSLELNFRGGGGDMKIAILGAVMVVVGMVGFSQTHLPVYILVFFVGLVLVVRGLRGAKNKANFGGAAHYFVGKGTAIAIYPDRKSLVLKNGSISKEYSFKDVREWETNVQTGGEIYGGGIATLGPNIRAAHANKKATGLFITVRDIDNPVWRINMPDKSDQQRWMEILRQLVNESDE